MNCPPPRHRLMLALWLLSICSVLSGCTLMQEVRPWQKESLAQPDMALTPDPLQSAHHEHVYFSREAGTGGHAVGAGGCGCN
jgi:hypothetical protein